MLKKNETLARMPGHSQSFAIFLRLDFRNPYNEGEHRNAAKGRGEPGFVGVFENPGVRF